MDKAITDTYEILMIKNSACDYLQFGRHGNLWPTKNKPHIHSNSTMVVHLQLAPLLPIL